MHVIYLGYTTAFFLLSKYTIYKTEESLASDCTKSIGKPVNDCPKLPLDDLLVYAIIALGYDRIEQLFVY